MKYFLSVVGITLLLNPFAWLIEWLVFTTLGHPLPLFLVGFTIAALLDALVVLFVRMQASSASQMPVSSISDFTRSDWSIWLFLPLGTLFDIHQYTITYANSAEDVEVFSVGTLDLSKSLYVASGGLSDITVMTTR